MNRIENPMYRPTENHVGVIYRWDRFHRFVDPNRWTFIFPGLESVFEEIRLDIRTTQISLRDLYTREKIALDVDLKIFYSVDLRLVDPERRIQVLHFGNEKAWDEIVGTAINDIARNIIFITRSFEELNSRAGRTLLKETLSNALAERVSGFGILLNPKFGVNIVDLQPNEEYRKALMEASAAKTVGAAAVDRLGPLLEQYQEQKRDKAVFALIMQIASAVAKTAQSPDIIFPSSNDYPNGGVIQGNGSGSIFPNNPGFSQTPRKPRSTAGD